MRPFHPFRKRPHGFTLIEVMVAVAIVGILAAVALPSYTSYLRRGELPEAFTFLSTDRVSMEQYYQDNRTYANSAGTGCGVSTVTRSTCSSSGPNKYFTTTCSIANSGASYTLTATGCTTRTTGYIYTINESNAQVTTSFAGATQTGKNCWLVKGSEC